MKAGTISFLSVILTPFVAFAANEGVPSYYQTSVAPTANQSAYGQYAGQGYTKYVGQSGSKQVVGSRTYSYQVPRPQAPTIVGTMTANGIAMPADSEPATSLYAGYSRRFADFEFETGVNSILEWDDMIWNEIRVGARHNFSLRDFDMYVYGEYAYGDMSHGGLSMDYDLKPFDSSVPEYGIFTISMGDQSGRSNHFRFGLAAHHVWDIGGWKLSPTFGYEIFKHNLEMSNHYYPNPGIYLPLMTDQGTYVFGNELGEYFSVPIGAEAPEDWYQVCMSPEDIKVVTNTSTGTGVNGFPYLGNSLTTGDYEISMGTIPWGVDANECVIIGGDGPVIVEGTTHIYNTTWSGFYVGLEIEKQMTLKDKLRFYMQFGLPKYSSEGIWPNRTDWQQNPSFLDEGSNGAYSYAAEMEYNYKISDRMQLSLKVDTNLFHVGKIGGELYIAEYSQYVIDENGQYVMQEVIDELGNKYYVPLLETVAAHTEKVSDSLKHATWQSFGLHIGVKYAF
ncbi:MAG: hypothetical protein IJ273_00540 [Alphaproteobacteria bacterium]|nr:hypothetical protein [Alphaproteobacteria bacterium]